LCSAEEFAASKIFAVQDAGLLGLANPAERAVNPTGKIDIDTAESNKTLHSEFGIRFLEEDKSNLKESIENHVLRKISLLRWNSFASASKCAPLIVWASACATFRSRYPSPETRVVLQRLDEDRSKHSHRRIARSEGRSEGGGR